MNDDELSLTMIKSSRCRGTIKVRVKFELGCCEGTALHRTKNISAANVKTLMLTPVKTAEDSIGSFEREAATVQLLISFCDFRSLPIQEPI